MRKFFSDWDRFWFEPQTARVLGAYRIVIGLMTIYAFGLLAKDVTVFFSDEGTLTVDTLSKVMDREFHSVLVWMRSPWMVVTALVGLLIAACLFTVGLWTRWSSIALYVLVMSFHERNNIVMNSGDTLLRTTLFFFMFAPAGAAWSVDALRRSLARPENAKDSPALIVPWAQRMMQFQLAVIYVTTAYAKSRGDLWHNGHALYYVFGLVDYHVEGVERLMNYPVLYSSLTFFTLFAEISIPFLLWFRSFRWYAFLMGLALHGWIIFGMTLPVFGTLMLCAYLPFVSEEEFQGFIERWRSKLLRYQMYFDGNCPLCQKSRRVIQAVDVLDRVEWVDIHHIPNEKWPKGRKKGDLLTAMHLITPSKGSYEGFLAFRRISRVIPVFWPLVPFLYIPGISILGNAVYQWVANNRFTFIKCPNPQHCKIHRP